MKKLFTACILFAGLTANAQEMKLDDSSKLLTVSEVVEAPNVSKNELYIRAKTWYTNAFKSAKAVIQLDEKDAGKILGKANTSVSIKVPIMGMIDAGWVDFTVGITCKDGKYRYIIDNFSHKRPVGANTQMWVDAGPLEQEKLQNGMMSRPNKKEWASIKEATAATMQALAVDLKKAMAKSDTDF